MHKQLEKGILLQGPKFGYLKTAKKGELIETNIRVEVTRDQRLGENGEMLVKWYKVSDKT